MKHFKIIVTFAGHILTAIAVFCVIGAGAWTLHLVRHCLEGAGLDDFILFGLHALELLLFACDLVATGFWAIMSTKTAIKEVLDASKESKKISGSSDDAK